MAGLKAFFNGYWLADLATEVISSAGALVKPITLNHAWTGAQYAVQHTAVEDNGELFFGFSNVGEANTFYYDLANGTVELQIPEEGVDAGMRWDLLVEADGATEMTYAAAYTFGTETAPDFSAMTDGDQVLLDFRYVSGSRVLVAASVVYAA